MKFEFATSSRIVFGRGSMVEAGQSAAALGGKALIVTGSDGSRAARLLDTLSSNGVGYVTFQVSNEPTLATVRMGLASARESGCDMVVAMGGGSALDVGKAVAMLITNGGDPLDYIEVIGHGRPISIPPVPFIAIPTTAGSGSEVTYNAVISSPEHLVKASLRSNLMLPVLAIVDPELAFGVPQSVTATTGMDALTQLIEPYLTTKSHPMIDPFCLEGIRLISRSLKHAFEDGENYEAREEMALASMYSGIALANAGLGAVHGLAAAIGGIHRARHGATCACLLGPVMSTNLKALRRQSPRNMLIERFAEIARVLIGSPGSTPEDGVAWIMEMCSDMKIPPLKMFGLTEDGFDDVIVKAEASNSMRGNPVALSRDDLTRILERAS